MRKTKSGKSEYLISWVGYSSDDNTWEKEKDIHNKDFFKKFNKSN